VNDASGILQKNNNPSHTSSANPPSPLAEVAIPAHRALFFFVAGIDEDVLLDAVLAVEVGVRHWV
jgi:hypothetical protein